MKKTALLLCALFVLGLCSYAQTLQISGRVASLSTNEPLVGASVVVKGTSTATTTDAQGNYSISIPKAGSTLVVSYAGMQTQEQIVRSAGVVNFNVTSVNNTLNEVIVNVGYGFQKKSVTTGAISTVRAKDIENVPNGRVEQVLQGRISGVTVSQNAGQPGSNSTVRVRGVTTFGDNGPLYVVDGTVVDAGGIGYLNQSDIESVDVMKDATSAAIYGTRAAAGVILVTTKKGRAGKITVSYNTFYGTSAPEKKLDMLNATEYATLINERLVAGGSAAKYADPSSFGTGTDWQAQIFNNDARRSSHELSISGGNDRSTFYASFGLQDQDGIVASDISHFNRKSFRLNSTHKINKFVTFGQTFSYNHNKNRGLGNTNSEFGGPLSSATNLDPITKVVEDPSVIGTGNYASPLITFDRNGNPYGISSNVGQEMSNPAAYINTRLGNYGWSDDFVGNAYVEVAPTSKIKVRSTFGGKLAHWGDYGFNPAFFLSPTIVNATNSIGKSTNNVFNWTIENTAAYTDKIGDHDFTVLLGQGAYVDNNGGGSSVNFKGIPVNNYQDASFGFAVTPENITAGAYTMVIHKISSLFARANYSYQDKYLFTGIIRRDGSTRFGANKKFGVFPSGSVGWVLSKENFWTTNQYVNTLKLRGGYGKVGNDNIGNFGYLATIGGGFNYTNGTNNGGAIQVGYAPLSLDNPDLHWEETTQANVGLDAQLFNNLTFTAEVYKKKTSGILRNIPIPGYVGVPNSPVGNVANMENSGLELELGYRKNIRGVNVSANGNVTFLKNKVTYVNIDAPYISGDASFQSMGPVTRTQVGQSYNSFYGYKTNGIFQTEADVLAYTDKNGGVIQPNAKPGDFRWVDTNGDGKIDEADKQFLGSNLPKVTFGLTLNAEYKGFDLMVFGQGAAGNKIFQGIRRLDVAEANWQRVALSRWRGAGTSNDYPRLTSDDQNGNFTQMSDFYLEKGDYLRLKVVQIGYTVQAADRLSKLGVAKLRLYVTAENLATLTNYTGYDPEIGGGVFGIDKGYYPQARSFIAGLQVTF